jgi:cobalamin biosynthesis protein CobD/CbiB
MQLLQEIINVAASILGFSPVLMIPVFVIVSLISRAFGVKSNLDKCKDFVLGVLCIIVGIGVAYFTGYTSLKAMFKTGLVLGSVSALTYQIFVSLFETLVSFANEKLDKIAGEDIDINENDVFGGSDD